MMGRSRSNVDIAILFWCYAHIDQCESKVRLLRWLNRRSKIYVLFGGSPAEAAVFEQRLSRYADDFYTYPEERPSSWKWEKGDLMITSWYVQRGRLLEWDSIFVAQWDMLVLAPVANLFESAQKDQLFLSGLRPLSEVADQWQWVAGERAGELEAFLRSLDDPEVVAYCCHFLVALLPRSFLEAFSARKEPTVGFLEYTLPTFALSRGFSFFPCETMQPWWHLDPAMADWTPKQKVLNAENHIPSFEDLLEHLLDEDGERVFHPVYHFGKKRSAVLEALALYWTLKRRLLPGRSRRARTQAGRSRRSSPA